ncbi:MAG: Do family serine endopeptidase [Ignavibacteriales bacterium]|nr:Do family serine endopeptidase [Ignavibacteriales bacterium]
MSMKSVVAAVLLIALGIVFGVTLVSSFKGVDFTFAGQDVKLGAQSKQSTPHPTLQSLNEAYHGIAKEVTPTVVYIVVTSKPKNGRSSQNPFFHFFGPDMQTPRQQPEVGAGSGVILTQDGYILTNNHVVESANSDGIEVTLWDNRVFKKAKLIGTDKYTDLAVIKVDVQDLPVPHLGNSDNVEVGHTVFAFGNPLGLTSTMTQGIVSALGRQLRIIEDGSPLGIEDFIQTDAAVNPGNSGGALVDVKGEVVGINSAIATTNARYQGYSFAIPINLAKKVATDLIKYGKVRRGYIGVSIQSVDATLAKANGLSKPSGVFVQTVNPGSAGAEAGLKEGDIILSVDGKEVNTSNQLQTIVASHYPGENVTLKVYRNGKSFEKKVTLKSRDEAEEEVAARNPKDESEEPTDAGSKGTLELENLGMTVRNLDSKVKKEYGVENGVLVENVEPMSESNKRGLAASDVIVSVGDQNISSVAQFDKVLKGKKAGDAVLMRVKGKDKSMRFVAIEVPGK